MIGTIRHRLLINRLADPAEVEPRLPEGVRPHVTTTGGVVIGCCLIAIESVRPWPAPAGVGTTYLVAAHRISIEAGPRESPTRAAYIPIRHTNSRRAVAIGGRLFPGVHQRSQVAMAYTEESVSWDVHAVGTGPHEPDGFSISTRASLTEAMPATGEVADISLGTDIGISPDHNGRLEGIEVHPSEVVGEQVVLTTIASEFLDSFQTATEGPTLLMTNVDVAVRRSRVPR